MTLVKWLVTTLAIVITGYLLPGVAVSSTFAALVTALVLGLLNTFIRPLFILLTLPINILSLGLFTFVINAVVVLLTSKIVSGFHVDGLLTALLFSLILSLIDGFLQALFRPPGHVAHH